MLNNLFLSAGLLAQIFSFEKKSIFKGIQLLQNSFNFIEGLLSSKYNLYLPVFNLRLFLIQPSKKNFSIVIQSNYTSTFKRYNKVKRWVRRSYISTEKRNNFFFK
jgi:hypothetical protein